MLAGSLDPTFSSDGKATLSFAGVAADVAVQPDGKAVVVGTHTDTSDNTLFSVARFNVDGSPDATFAIGGLATTQLSNVGESSATAVAIAPDGKIVVVGTATVDAGFDEPQLAAARYNPDGSLDNTFDDNGLRSLDLGDFASWTYGNDVAVQPDGKIVIVGETYRAPDADFFAIRLLVGGELDPTFGAVTPGPHGPVRTGKRFVGFGHEDAALAVKLNAAGDIFVAGQIRDGSASRRVGLVRLSGNGDPVFLDGDGKIDFQLPGRAFTDVADLHVQQDGKIVIAGNTLSPNGQNDFFIARFTTAGVLDNTFGESNLGFTLTDLGGNDVVAGITETPTGGGGGYIVSGNSGGMAAVKYTASGLLDTSFGIGGKLRTLFGGAANIAPGPGRRVMLAGGADFATERILLQGAREVSGAPLDISSTEGSTNTASLFVSRTERLPFPTRVFFSIGGTASMSNTRSGARDWTMPGLVITSVITSTSATGYVDIPANETLVVLTFTPINDSLAEPTETAIFTVQSNSIYEITSPSSGTIKITDDDTSNSSIGTTTVAKPPKQVGVGEELQAAVTWTVPSGGWRQLSTIQLRLRDIHDGDAFAILTFDEATNSFSVGSSGAGASPVSLVLSKCTFQAAGPTAPTVKVIFTFRFNAVAEKRRFALDVAATNDIGAFSGFAQVGEFLVHKKKSRTP